MGVCGCGDFVLDDLFVLPDKTELSYRIYRGCRDCFNGLAIDLSLFTSNNEWTKGHTPKKIQPTEDGGKVEGIRGSFGIPIPLFEMQDFTQALDKLDGFHMMSNDQREEFIDWMKDCGPQLLSKAIEIFQKRMKDIETHRRLVCGD